MKRSLMLASLLFLAGCTTPGPYEPSEREEQLLKAYASLIVHQEQFGITADPDSVALYQLQTDSILASYGLDREEFRTEFEDLINSPERFEPLFQKIYSDLQQRVRK